MRNRKGQTRDEADAELMQGASEPEPVLAPDGHVAIEVGHGAGRLPGREHLELLGMPDSAIQDDVDKEEVEGEVNPVRSEYVTLPRTSDSEGQGETDSTSYTRTLKSGVKAPEPRKFHLAPGGAAPDPKRQPKLDDATLLAYANLNDQEFRSAMGRAGTRFAQAMVGGKPDMSGWDALDRASARNTVGQAKDQRQAQEDRQGLRAGELKLASAEEEASPDSNVSRIAQSAAESMLNLPEGTLKSQSYRDLAANSPQMKALLDEQVRYRLEEMRQGGATERFVVAHKDDARKLGLYAENVAEWRRGNDIKERDQEFKFNQQTLVDWEPADPSIVVPPTVLKGFRETDANTNMAQANLKALRALFQKTGGKLVPSPELGQMANYWGQMVQNKNKLDGNGVMNGDDIVNIAYMLGRPGDARSLAFQQEYMAKIDAMLQQTASNLEAHARAAGLRRRASGQELGAYQGVPAAAASSPVLPTMPSINNNAAKDGRTEEGQRGVPPGKVRVLVNGQPKIVSEQNLQIAVQRDGAKVL